MLKYITNEGKRLTMPGQIWKVLDSSTKLSRPEAGLMSLCLLISELTLRHSLFVKF